MVAKETRLLFPAESGKLIVEKAQDVKVIPEGVERAADEIFNALQSGRLSLKNFKQVELHPKVADEKAIDWIFLVDTLNFSFWSGVSKQGLPEPKWEVAYNGNVYTGYFAFCAGVNRAMQEEGLDLTNPSVYGSLTVDALYRIFRSETSTPIPLAEERVKSLKQVADVLIEKYCGSFANCVKQSDRSAMKLLKLITEEFPCYRDQNVYDESTIVSFYKRAQILVADIWACFEGKDLGTFDDIDSITMFADYRVPQSLLHFGALEYSSSLLETLEKDVELENGDRREMEIRGASIHAVELINLAVRRRLREAGKDEKSINSIMIDHYLWDFRREHATELEKYPYHKTRCIFY